MSDKPLAIQSLRREYAARALDEATVDADPIKQFRGWFEEALRAELLDANAMTLATVSADHVPAARIVLLKDLDDRGFVFFTHYDSPKGNQLAVNPMACLLFYWAELERQVRITGAAERVAAIESDQYFGTRPRDSQVGAWAAHQSEPIADRAALEARVSALQKQYEGRPVPRPPDWGGYRVIAEQIEFWQGRPSRLHDRLLYTKRTDGTWQRVRLAP